MDIIVKRSENFDEWYKQSIVKSDMINYSDVHGCYILRPASYALWEKIRSYIDSRIKKMGVNNAYFPLFGTQTNLETFPTDVAWVTKAGTSTLTDPIFVRSTSEALIYSHFANWIKSCRDMPLKINQWCNVVRWNFEDCKPFIRSREFLWQEAHTCFLEKIDADIEVRMILGMYADVYQKLLAIPDIIGYKSGMEKFVMSDYTTTVECFVPVIGKVIEGATVHYLGQNFSKIFNIKTADENQPETYAYQNSWKITTRAIGLTIMIHGDDNGLVLPPQIASIQVIIIPIGINKETPSDDIAIIHCRCRDVATIIRENGLTVEIDDKPYHEVDYKFNYWKLRGVPLRIEIGPNEIKQSTLITCRRDTGEKTIIPYFNNIEIANFINFTLDQIQESMYLKAEKIRDESIVVCQNKNEFMITIDEKKMPLVPWCEKNECEESIISMCKNLNVKSLCIPFNQKLAATISNNPTNIITGSSKCFCCDFDAKSYTLFGSSY